MNMVMNRTNDTFEYNQNGHTVENQLYYTNDLRIQQYKASDVWWWKVWERTFYKKKISKKYWITRYYLV